MGAASKQKLIDISYKLFQEKEPEEIHVREIAALAGVTTGSFYHHFKDKYAVLSAKKEADEAYIAAFDTVNFEGPALTQLRSFLAEYMGSLIAADGLRVTRIVYMTKELSRPSSPAFRMITGKLLFAAAAAGELRDGVSPEDFLEQLLQGFQGTVFAWCRRNGTGDIREMLHEMLDIYLYYATKINPAL